MPRGDSAGLRLPRATAVAAAGAANCVVAAAAAANRVVAAAAAANHVVVAAAAASAAAAARDQSGPGRRDAGE
eukprot:364076-Chlamydomonas_euryale.AAC.4